MKKALLIHGSGGSPEGGFLPWLKSELEKEGYEVMTPQFPISLETQKLENWLSVADEVNLDEDTIAVGFSLGAPFLINLLEKKALKSAYLIAGFASLLGNQFDPVINTFVDKEFDWKRIKENCQNINFFYSDNDPYVPIEKASELEEKLGTKGALVEGAGHFNSETGFLSFPLLLEKILEE